jgi:two-component system LytT family sensor kinase
MEYDNDKKIRPLDRIEILYWVLLALFYPVINALTVFPHEWRSWFLLFFVNVLLLPIIIVYSRIIVPRTLLVHKPLLFSLLSVAVFSVCQLLILFLYQAVIDPSSEPGASYFRYSWAGFIRESIWIILYMFLAITIAFHKKALDDRDLINELKRDNADFKIKYLRSQLNPHFLFNTLNSIYSLSLQKSDQTPEVVVKLADIMRYLINDCDQPKIPLEKEIEFIRNYLDIERIRHNADIRFKIEGDTKDVMIEPSLFISFIENGFKHAFDNSYTNAFVYITLKSEPGQITLTVVNNTNTDIETQAKKVQGTGLKNSKNLLEMLYPGFYALNIIQTQRLGKKHSIIRFKNARDRMELLYPDSHTLDVILGNNAFTVSLIIKSGLA